MIINDEGDSRELNQELYNNLIKDFDENVLNKLDREEKKNYEKIKEETSIGKTSETTSDKKFNIQIEKIDNHKDKIQEFDAQLEENNFDNDNLDSLEYKIKRYSLNKAKVDLNKKDFVTLPSDTYLSGRNTQIDTLSVYTVTWNMFGQTSSSKEIDLLLPKDNFYHIYAIGTEECMRSILFSMFYNDKSAWEELAQ